jgi:RNA polymerase sigma-70 factor (ECF subfamily)
MFPVEASRMMWRMDSLEGPARAPAAHPATAASSAVPAESAVSVASVVSSASAEPSKAAEPEIDEAIRAAQHGDEAAFRVLFRHLQPRLLRYLTGLVGAEAEDVAADAWLQIARDLGSFQGDADRFRGWASRIARNRAIDHLRYTNRRPTSDFPVDDLIDLVSSENVERAALEQLSADQTVAIICQLPREQAEAVLLRVVMGLDAKTAGQVLGKRPGAVRTAAHRGLRTLAKRL